MEHLKWYKWVVLAASLFVTMFIFGLLFTFGSLYTDILDTYHESRSKSATVQATLIGVALCTGMLSGTLISRLGFGRIGLLGAILCPLGLILAFFAESIVHLYICIGVITGFGISLIFMSTTVAIGKSFVGTQRLLALAIQNSGISVAGIILPYILHGLVGTYGLNGSFLLLGGIYLNCIPIARLLAIVEECYKYEEKLKRHRNKSLPTGNGNKGTEVSEIIDADRIRQPQSCGGTCFSTVRQELQTLKTNIVNVTSMPYILNSLAVGIVIASLNGYMAVVLDILKWKGLSRSESLLAFPVAYGVGLVARLLPGVIKQVKGVNSLTLPIIYSICGCTGQLLIYFLSSLHGVLLGCALSGIAVSGVISAATIVVVQIVGDENIAMGIGVIGTIIGVLSAVSGPAYGYMKDSSNSYGTVLMLTTGLQFVGTCLFVLTAFVRRRANAMQRTYTVDIHVDDDLAQSERGEVNVAVISTSNILSGSGR